MRMRIGVYKFPATGIWITVRIGLSTASAWP